MNHSQSFEQVCPEIQSNVYNLKDNSWYIYTIKNQVTRKQLPLEECLKICEELGVPFVPVICHNKKLNEIMPDVKTAENYAEKFYWKPGSILYEPKENEKLWKDYLQHEGVVVRSMNYDKDSGIGCSFKVKNLEYQEKSLKSIYEVAYKLSLK